MLRTGPTLLTLLLFLAGAVACGGNSTSGSDVAEADTASDTTADVEDGALPACESDEECVEQLPTPGECRVARCRASACVIEVADDNTYCDNGNACTQFDFCTGGECQDGLDVDCDDEDSCTEDTCDPVEGCLHALAPACRCDGPGAVCNDDNPCTDDSCDEDTGLCVFAKLDDGTSCDAGFECTAGDTCQDGVCQPGTADPCEDGNPCTDATCEEETGCDYTFNDRACDDGDPCTVLDACAEGTCGGQPSASACPCTEDADCAAYDDDEDRCDGGYDCQAGGCVAGAPVECAAPADPCLQSVCEAATGDCVEEPAPDGTACDDGESCTVDDECSAGVCAGVPGGCPCTTHTDCTQYDDGDLCNGIFQCLDGSCQYDPGTIINCGEPDRACRTLTCNPATGRCADEALEDNAPCDDLDACTQGERCLSGLCGGGSPVDCDDDNPCTFDRCDVAVGCVHRESVLDCDDGDACTMADRCVDGECVGAQRSCDDRNPCTRDICDAVLGCIHSAANGETCSDGNPCTEGDVCFNSECSPGVVDVCGTCVDDAECLSYEDGNLCNGLLRCIGGLCRPDPDTIPVCDFPRSDCSEYVCDPPTGVCIQQPRREGLSCNDGNACTYAGYCSGGLCVSETSSCDDGNPCTDDSCSPATGCAHLDNSATCDDGNLCSESDRCIAGVCRPGATSGCARCRTTEECASGEDTNPCNGSLICRTGSCVVDPDTVVFCEPEAVGSCFRNVCDTVSGICTLVPRAAESHCDDGEACTADDRCALGSAACEGTAITCDDGNDCTNDRCDSVLGCVFEVNDASCDDGNACTRQDVCVAGECTGTSPVDCDDENPCTTDTCDTETAECGHAQNAVPCDDGDACTVLEWCQLGECVGQPVPCDDANPCTTDTCDAIAGCVHTPNTDDCDDGQPCTINEQCADGICTPGVWICEERCYNGLDDDDNGLTDCDDPACAELGSCQGLGRCEPFAELYCQYDDTASLEGEEATNQVQSYNCLPGNYDGPEVAWTYVADCNGVADARLQVQDPPGGMRPRVDLFIVLQDPLGVCDAANDCMAKGVMQYIGSTGQAQALFRVEDGVTYYLIADGQSGDVADVFLELLCYCD